MFEYTWTPAGWWGGDDLLVLKDWLLRNETCLTRFADATMTNLIGDDVLKAPLTGDSGTFVHVYGKREVRPGRKMGHLIRLSPKTG